MDRPLHILFVSPCFGTYGGIEAFVLALAQYIHQQPGFEVRICWKKTKKFHAQETFIARCQESGVSFEFAERSSSHLWKVIQWADVVHGQNASPDTVLFSKILRKKIILTIHNYRRPKLWRNFLWSLAAKFAARRLYNSHFVWKTWESNTPHTGSLCIPTVSNLPQGEIKTEERKGFCFASRWIPNKGLETLVQAYHQANLSPEKWPLHLIGDGPLRPSIEEWIHLHQVKGIQIHGFVDEVTKADLIRQSKWMVVPPHTQEDLGLTAIEARSVGIPCIATRDGGLPEAAGPSAILCNPHDVDDLTKSLKQAAEMDENEYINRVHLCHESLQTFLKPLSFYTELYRKLLTHDSYLTSSR